MELKPLLVLKIRKISDFYLCDMDAFIKLIHLAAKNAVVLT